MSVRRLILAEHDRHVVDFLARGYGGTADRWIALGPSAMATLEARTLPFSIPEDFAEFDQLDTRVTKLHADLEVLCDELDSRLLERCPDLARLELRPFRFAIYPLMIVLDSAAQRVFYLKYIRRAHPDAKLVVHVRLPQRPGPFGLLYSSCETLWGRAATMEGSGLDVEALRESSPSPVSHSTRELVKNIISRSLLVTTAARFVVRHEFRSTVGLLGRGPRVLIPDGSPDWLAATSELSRSGLRPVFLAEPDFDTTAGFGSAEPLVDQIVATMPEILSIEGISIAPLVGDRLAAVWRVGPAAVRRAFALFRKVQRRHRILAVLRTSSSTPVAHAFNRAAQAAGVPVLVWQHGMITRRPVISQMRDYADMMTSDAVLAYGREPAAAYQASSPRFPRARVVANGSAAIESFRALGPRIPMPGPVRLLFATTNYVGNDWSLGYWPGASDRLLYRDQCTLLQGLLPLVREGRAVLRIKVHPDTSHGEPPWVTSLAGVPGVGLVRGRSSFAQHISWCDAVLLDFPSTTLLQSLAARRPTFVLSRYSRMSEEAEALLARSAIASVDAANLSRAVGAYALAGRFDADPDNGEFLSACGVASGDSAWRAALFARRMLEGECTALPGGGDGGASADEQGLQ